MDACQLERCPCLVILPSRGSSRLERLLLERLSLGEPAHPLGDSCASVEPGEAALVVVGLDRCKRLVGQLDRA